MLADGLDNAKARRDAGIARLLASDKEGERQNALLALARLLPGELLASVITAGLARSRANARQVEPLDAFRRWQRLAKTIRSSAMPLTAWERDFLADVAVRSDRPTDRQGAQLQRLADRLQAWEASHA